MNTSSAINSLDLNRKNLVLIIGDSIGENIDSSLVLARRLQSEQTYGRRVLYVNTVQSAQVLGQRGKEVIGPEFRYRDEQGMDCRTLTRGSLSSVDEEVRAMFFGKYAVRTVVINSWEFSAEDYRTRDRVVSMLRRWVVEDGVQVIVFAQFRSAVPTVMKVQIGGIGKLAGLADGVFDIRERPLDIEQDEPAVEPKPSARIETPAKPQKEKVIYVDDESNFGRSIAIVEEDAVNPGSQLFNFITEESHELPVPWPTRENPIRGKTLTSFLKEIERPARVVDDVVADKAVEQGVMLGVAA